MKKISLIITMAIFAICANAQNEQLMQQIKDKFAAFDNYTSDFNQTKNLKGMKKGIESQGTLYAQDNKMAMIYSQPEGDFIIINDTDFAMKSRGKMRKHNIKEGSEMLKLRNTLIYAIQGDIQAIATETNSTIKYNETDKSYRFVVKANKPQKRGYKEIILNFDKETLLLNRMRMVEANDNSTVYKLKNTKTNTLIDAKVFETPKK